jgi:hypothetical protein
MFPLAVAVAQGIKKHGQRTSSHKRATNTNTGVSKSGPLYEPLPPGVYERGMANANKKEEMLKAHIITNKIEAEIAPIVQAQLEHFRQEKIAEIDAMAESDLKTLLKSYRKPTPLVNRLKKSVKRTLRIRTANNSRRELIELAKHIYLPSAVRDYKESIEAQERQVAISRLTPAQKIQLDEETDYIAHERAGNIRATYGQGISTYEWISPEEQASRIAEYSGSMGGKRKTRRHRM